ncbi:hypothetical protein Acr_17g0008300 [Actinidia rufa]|uniref:Uncharacterized protein n=1 Tax=Actinidia rufa TaxID=165716 RepID=A0A7J0G3B3_9ERIC|nr:hypothetical protein Acr_17g0008300 [Actinidia rufa]
MEKKEPSKTWGFQSQLLNSLNVELQAPILVNWDSNESPNPTPIPHRRLCFLVVVSLGRVAAGLGPLTPTSHRDSGSPRKRQAIGSRTQYGTSGTSSSSQQGDSSSSVISKFRPNYEAESHFNCSFKICPVFVSRGVSLDEFSKTRINAYFTKWGKKHLIVSDGVVCLKLVREFFANIHSSDKDEGTLKSYVRGTYLDFSNSNICSLHNIQRLDPEIVGFPYPPSTSEPSLKSLANLLLVDEGDWPPGSLSHLKQKGLKDVFCVLNHVALILFYAHPHVSEIDETCAQLMHAIASDLPIDIVSEPHETRLPVGKPISRYTLRMSNAHLRVAPPPLSNFEPM